MTKQNLVNYIAEEAGLTKADSARALDAFMNGIGFTDIFKRLKIVK